MPNSYFALLDMAIVGVPTILFVIWQLVSINREIARDKARKDSQAEPSPERAGHAIGEHRLDDR
jgi:hypothetical protein